METTLANGANATVADQNGGDGESLLVRAGDGGNFHSGEGNGGKGGDVVLVLGQGGEGWEESAIGGDFVLKKPDGTILFRVRSNGDVLVPGFLALSGVTADSVQVGAGGFLPGGRVNLPKGDVTGSVSSSAKTVYLCNTAAGAVSLDIKATDKANVTTIIVKDRSGNAGTNHITVTTEDGGKIDGQDLAVIDTNWGSLTLVSDGFNLFKV